MQVEMGKVCPLCGKAVPATPLRNPPLDPTGPVEVIVQCADCGMNIYHVEYDAYRTLMRWERIRKRLRERLKAKGDQEFGAVGHAISRADLEDNDRED